MASRLNPHASVFIPTSHFPTPPAFSSGYIPPAGPPPFTPFSHGRLLPPHPHPLPFLPPPSPPPPPPPPFISVQRPCILPPPPPPTVAAEGEVNPIWVNRPSNVRITTRGTGARAGGGGGRGRGFGGGRGGRYQPSDFGVRERERERERRRGKSMSRHRFTEEEENNNNNGGRKWRNLKKHGMRYLREDENNTTVMIKNIPSDFTRQMLIEYMDRHCMSVNQRNGDRRCVSAYDFLYLPIDFKTRKNKGYAFVNFTHPSAVWKFFNASNSKKWESTDSPKIRMIICARIQGKRALVQHFEKSRFECETDEYLPVCFKPARDGSGNYVEVTTVGGYRRGC